MIDVIVVVEKPQRGTKEPMIGLSRLGRVAESFEGVEVWRCEEVKMWFCDTKCWRGKSRLLKPEAPIWAGGFP